MAQTYGSVYVKNIEAVIFFSFFLRKLNID